MKFNVIRTSDLFGSDGPPCDNAIFAGKDEYETYWQVEINSLDELLAFINKNGEIVMRKDSLEIYDTYRE